MTRRQRSATCSKLITPKEGQARVTESTFGRTPDGLLNQRHDNRSERYEYSIFFGFVNATTL